MKFNLEKFFVSRMNKIKSILKTDNLPRLGLMLAVLLILYFLYVNYLKEGFESKSEDLETQLSDGKKAVLFYADWCGHCKSLKPIWDDAAKEINDKKNPSMIKVNCGNGTDGDKKIMDKYSIDGYPTIIIFEDGKPSPYDGNRTKKDLMDIFS